MIKSNLKIGVEIETNLDRDTNQYDCLRKLKDIFKPTNNYGNFGTYGVMEVKDDGSLTNGVELCTIGRRIDFFDLYNQYAVIIDNIFPFNPVMNERCGLHNHMLLDYGSDYNSMEKKMPSIILKNFIQLIRRHMPELVWITSTVKSELGYVTRMDKFCTADTLLKTTPLTKPIHDYINIVSEPSTYSGRYKFINLRPMKYTTEDEITRFHLELRFPDGSLYPAQIASQNILYSAILLKAVRLSEIGTITTGTTALWEETKELYGKIRNHNDMDRLSVPPTIEEIDKIKTRCVAMLNEFKAEINSIDRHAMPILNVLCETPISIMRRTMEEKEINDSFDLMVQNMYASDESALNPIIEVINLNKIFKAPNEENWIQQLAVTLREDLPTVKKKLFDLSRAREIYFDKETGSYAFK